MDISELQVINMAKAWKRAKPERKKFYEKMLVQAVESLERQESFKKKRSSPSPTPIRKRPALRLVKD
jgi:hypothetical protein